MKTIDITILYDLDENNNWRWYDIYQTSKMTPIQAIRNYLKEMDFKDWKTAKIEGNYDNSEVIATDYDVKAEIYKI